jgi:heme exporter protein D
MAEYFNMGGYAAYIWPAYGLTAFIMIALLVRSLSSVKRNQKILDTLEASGARRRAPADKPTPTLQNMES